MPPEGRHVIEFRDSSWYDAEVLDLRPSSSSISPMSATAPIDANWLSSRELIHAFLVVAMIQELTKFLILRYSAYPLGAMAHPIDGLVYATALGLGPLPPTEVGSSVRPTITAEYFIRDNLGLEVLASLPFQHDIDILAEGDVVVAQTTGSAETSAPTRSWSRCWGSGRARAGASGSRRRRSAPARSCRSRR